MKTEIQRMTAGAAHISIPIEINAPVGRTWQSMVEDIGSWWRKDFLVCEGSLGMHLEPRIGGLLFEKVGDGGGFAWGHVISYQPNKQLGYVAQIVPPWGGPAQSVVQITLESAAADPENATLLTLTDSLIGHVTDDLASCLDDGWRQLYGEGGLKTYIEEAANSNV